MGRNARVRRGRNALFLLYRRILASWHTTYVGTSFVLLLFLFISAPNTLVSAGQFGVGEHVGIPAQTCEAFDDGQGWRHTELAKGKPSVEALAPETAFTASNAAVMANGNGALVCKDFSFTDQRRKDVIVALSLASTTALDGEPQEANDTREASNGAFLLGAAPSILSPNLHTSTQNFDGIVRVSVSDDNGDSWHPLYLLTDTNTSNAARGGYIAVRLPAELLSDTSGLQIRAEGLRKGDTSTRIYVDSMFFAYTVAPEQRLTLEPAVAQDAGLPAFSIEQPAAFQLEVDKQGEGIVQGLGSRFGNKTAPPEGTVDVTIKNADGDEIPGVDAQAIWGGKALNGNDVWDISLSQPADIMSGRNTAIVTLRDSAGNSQSAKQDFLWGVLAINTHKSMYQPGNTVNFDMSVLDEKGEMVCNAGLLLTIEGPVQAELSTEANTIAANKECEEKKVVEKPDYSGSWKIPDTPLGNIQGEYKTTLTAQTKNGTYTIHDSFWVGDPEAVTVTRTAPTRIMPANRYTVLMKVQANQTDFDGVITETAPDSFAITYADKIYLQDADGTTYNPAIVPVTMTAGASGEQIISWKVQLKKGQSYQLRYTYKAPDVSPAFYLTGPLSFTEGERTVFQERRQWHIAGDAPWLVGWTYRKALTINQLVVDATLTNFPVAVRLTSATFPFAKANTDGSDIRFTGSDMVTELSYEMERYNDASDLAEFWVKIPSVSGTVNTVFYIYYGNPYATTTTSNPANVWSANDVAVLHMDDDPARVCTPSPAIKNVCDSTANGTHATAMGTMFTDDLVAGKVGNSTIFDGTDDKLDFGDVNATDGLSRMTVSGWVKPDLLEDWSVLFAKFSTGTSKWAVIESGGGQGTNNDVTVTVSNGTDVNCYTTSNILVANTWGYWTMVFDGTLTGNANRLKFYYNGVQQTLTCILAGGGTPVVPATAPSNTASLFMSQYTSTQYLQGTVDEARISNDAKTAAWIKAAYNGDNNTLLTAYGSEEVGDLPAETPELIRNPTFDNAQTSTTTPVLGTFSSYEPEGQQVQYEIQIDDNASFSSPATHNSSNFAANGFDAASYNGLLDPAGYQTAASDGFVDGGTYWWRIRALDVGGTATWSAYTPAFSITITSTVGPINQWFQTTDGQFDTNDHYGTQNNGAGSAILKPATYRYIRFQISQRRGPSANSIQISEFTLRRNGANVAWPVGSVATNPGGSNPGGETPDKAIDGSIAATSKWLDLNFATGADASLTGTSILQVDVGAANTVAFNGYQWATANDVNARDPTGWSVFGSNNATNWTLLDSKTNQTITTTRNVYATEQVIQPAHDYRYVRWEVTAQRDVDVGVQYAEFQLLSGSTAVAWPSGSNASTIGGSHYTNQTPNQAIDGNTATKFLDFNFGAIGKSVLQVDVGSGNTVRFDGYRFTTADDAASRDPISWNMYGSADGINWRLLDNRANETITASRLTNTATYAPVHKPGSMFSTEIFYSSVFHAESWREAFIGSNEPSGSNILLRFYYASGSVCDTLIPDASLAGNSAGFDANAVSAINLSGLNTTSFDVICLEAQFVPGTTTADPTLFGWYTTWLKNLAPNTPASSDLNQTRVDTTPIPIGAWSNQSNVRFVAINVTDANTSDTLALCVERRPLGTNFTDVSISCGTPTAYTGTPLTLTVTFTSGNNSEFHWQAWIEDSGHTYNELSSRVSFGNNAETARDYAIDTLAPTGGTVYDGTSVGVDATYSTTSLSDLSANWSGVDSTSSGLLRYEYSIGTAPGGITVKGWTDIGTATAVTAANLTLQTSQPYYFNIRTTDNAGNVQSPVISSNGQIVAPSLSFAASPATMTFATLTPANTYTDTKTTTLTTSTNAYAGYVIRLAATGNLQSGARTLSTFNGGTYAAPDSWQAADRGIGYTSSDASIQGANKFQAATCPGGSALAAPGCYAPYSLTKPGDIVADHVANVTGTPITNQQFTITNRVTASAAQPAGSYATVLIYAATALY